MEKASVGTSVYVYSLDSNGNVIERKATIARKKPQKSTWLLGYMADK